MNIKPLFNNIFVEAVNEEKTTKGGIFIPESAEEKPGVGKVIAVGPGKTNNEGKLIPLNIKVGDKVLFTKYAPNEIKIDEKEYLVIKEDDVLAIIEE
ncbi:MAG: co-chaperone GroES [Candidatus Pacebacteria bacterium]|jgi:chaperonin GroES|nr:co-chaperone GroES [Candidatus Paceibacterota bacterium]